MIVDSASSRSAIACLAVHVHVLRLLITSQPKLFVRLWTRHSKPCNSFRCRFQCVSCGHQTQLHLLFFGRDTRGLFNTCVLVIVVVVSVVLVVVTVSWSWWSFRAEPPTDVHLAILFRCLGAHA